MSPSCAVVYDGDCAVCTRLAHVLERLDTRGTFEVLTSQSPAVSARFPWIPPAAYRESLQVVEGGRTWQGARADWLAVADVALDEHPQQLPRAIAQDVFVIVRHARVTPVLVKGSLAG